MLRGEFSKWSIFPKCHFDHKVLFEVVIAINSYTGVSVESQEPGLSIKLLTYQAHHHRLFWQFATTSSILIDFSFTFSSESVRSKG